MHEGLEPLVTQALALPYRILELDSRAVQCLGSMNWEAGIASVYQLAAQDLSQVGQVSRHFMDIMRAVGEKSHSGSPDQVEFGGRMALT